MAFPIEGVRKPATLVDKDGNEVPLVFDGSIWRLPVDASGGGGGTSIVEIEDGAGTTKLAVKPNGTLVGLDGAALVGGRDGGGALRMLSVNASGEPEITDRNGALLGSDDLQLTMETAELANVNIFPIGALVLRDGICDIEIVGDANGVWSLVLTRLAVTRVAELKDGANIVADKWQVFSFPVRAGDTLNLRVDTAMTVSALINFRDR